MSLHIDSLIKELSILGHVMDTPSSPSQSTWSSESVAKVKGMYCVKVESTTSKGIDVEGHMYVTSLIWSEGHILNLLQDDLQFCG